MPDWTKAMSQSFEYYIVNPGTWKDEKKITNIKKCTINRDLSSETLGSGSFDITGTLHENYVRVYLVTIQNGIKENHALGTLLVQTPSSKFDGKTRVDRVSAYTPLIELKEDYPPIGFAIEKGKNENNKVNILEKAYEIGRAHV